MSRYLKLRDHGYLMEAAACTKVLEDLRRIEAKYARTVEKECSVRQAEFEKVMQYHSERELQDDFGWGFITEAQYDRYRLLFQQGEGALGEPAPLIGCHGAAAADKERTGSAPGAPHHGGY